MNRKRITLLLAAISAFFMTCKPDFSVNDVKQDISIAYCLLNVNETNHYVKIYKAFLTDGNAYTYASNSGLEAISYMDSIKVTMEEYINGTLKRTIPFDTTTAIPKDSGTFPYPTQILYVAKNVKLDPAATYRLILKNKYTSKECYAETKVVNNFRITQPQGELNLTYNKESVKCALQCPENGASYEVYQIFRYIEVDKNTGKRTQHSVKRKISSSEILSLGSPIVINYNINNIYKVIGSQVKENDNVIRYIDSYKCIDYEAWVAGNVFLLYLKANNQSSTILNDKIAYTNFVSKDNSAFGIFSSRNSVKNTYLITSVSEDSLVAGQYTKHLGFIKFENNNIIISKSYY